MIASLQGLRNEFVVYRTEEVPRLLHAFKAALAVVISMLICMRLELRGPGTAMVSAVIVMLQQQSGMVIARAFYRGIGFCAGSLVGLTLIGLFAQQPALFISGLSLWIGFCVTGSSYYRNNQSYAFVLSGYVACITTLTDWHDPYDVITNVIQTLSEVVIGVGTGSVVSALIFPQKVVPSLEKWRDAALTSLLSALRGAASGAPVSDPMSSYLALVKESVAIEGLRTAAVFEEPDMRLRNEALLTMDRTFLNTIANIYAVFRARQISASVDVKERATIDDVFGKLVTIAEGTDADTLRTSEGLDHLLDRLQGLKDALPRSTQSQGSDENNGTVMEMGGAEAYLAVSSLREFCMACKIILDPPRVQFMQSIVHAIAFMRSVPIRSNGTSAIVSGLRATTAVAAVGAAWILSGWDNGYSAVVSAGITSGFFSLFPAPGPASWQAFVGCLIACAVGFFVNFSLMPTFGDVSLLALCFGMVLFCGSYVNMIPAYASLGAGINIYFCYVLTPTNVAVYDPPAFLDRGFALLVGIGISAIAFSLVVPREGMRLARQYASQIRGLLQDGTQDEIDADDAAEIETTLRDLVVRIVTVPLASKPFLEQISKWAFGQLWMVNTLLHVRGLDASETQGLPSAWNGAQQTWLRAIGEVAQNPNPASIEAALKATNEGLAVLSTRAGQSSLNEAPLYQTSSNESAELFELRARLYSTRAALTDQLTNAPPLSVIGS